MKYIAVQNFESINDIIKHKSQFNEKNSNIQRCEQGQNC